jgi:hypothetical protein
MVRLLLGGLVGLLATGAARAGANDYFSELVKDFGVSPKGAMLQHYFSVTNKSGVPITLGQPRVSCGCVSASVLKPQLAPNESTAVVAYMDTNRIPTPGVLKQVIVYVPVHGAVHEEVQLRVQTVTRADLIISPGTLDLKTVTAGQPATASTKVTFFSDLNWKVTDAKSTGVYLKPTVKPAAGQTGTYELTVDLDPRCPVGNWSADVYLTTSVVGMEKLRVPVVVNVVKGAEAAAVSVNPQTVAFGDVALGKLAEKQVMVQSPMPFNVKEIKKGPAGLDVAALANGARPTHVFKLSFTPTAAGPAKGAFEIVTDSKDAPTVSIPWTANVVK